MTNIEVAGYIVHTDEAIFGVGDTRESAWADAVRFLDPESGEDDSTLHVKPATAALLAEVADQGGNIAWVTVSGVACTLAEEP
jgi:hypothetical protein